MSQSKRGNRSNNKSGWFGVRNAHGSQFQATITTSGINTNLGSSYNTAKEAALAFDAEAIKLGRPLDSLNLPDDVPPGYTPAQQPLNSNNTIGFRGISKQGMKWIAQIRVVGGKRTNLGTFDTPMEAALSYDKAVHCNRAQAQTDRSNVQSTNFSQDLYEKLVLFHETKNAVFEEINESGFNKDDQRHMIIMEALFPLFPAAEDEKDAVDTNEKAATNGTSSR